MDNTIKIVDMTGKDAGEYTFDAAVLETEKGSQAVKDTVVAFQNAMREGNACTKTKGNVRGGGAKPWRQKGTGRARAGSSRSPIWRSGGVVFGPLGNRNYINKVNKKVRTLALRRAFTERLIEGSVIVVDEIKIADKKTKSAVTFLNAVGAGSQACIVDVNVLFNENLMYSTGNLAKDRKGLDIAKGVSLQDAATLNVYSVLRYKKIVVSKAALDVLVSRMKGGE